MKIGLVDKYGDPITKGSLVKVTLGDIDTETGKFDPISIREKIYHITYSKSKAAFAFTTESVDSTENSIPICEFMTGMTRIVSIEVLAHAV